MERLESKGFESAVSPLLLVCADRSGPDPVLLLLDPNIPAEIKSDPAENGNILSNVGRKMSPSLSDSWDSPPMFFLQTGHVACFNFYFII